MEESTRECACASIPAAVLCVACVLMWYPKWVRLLAASPEEQSRKVASCLVTYNPFPCIYPSYGDLCHDSLLEFNWQCSTTSKSSRTTSCCAVGQSCLNNHRMD